MRQRWKPASRSDVADIVGRLRQEDVEECMAFTGVPPAIHFADYIPGQADVIYNSDGVNVALAGTSDVHYEAVGQIWMMATPDLENHQMEFLKNCKRYINEQHEKFPILFNWVHAKNEVHLKWLRWCGFQFLSRKESFGAGREPFYEFIKVKTCA